MKKNIIWILLALLIILLILWVSGVFTKEEGEKIATEKVGTQTITESVNGSGKIFPEVELKLSPDISGEVTELYVQEGDSVTKGQIIARINPDIYVSMVDRAAASVNQSKAGVDNAAAVTGQIIARLKQAEASYKRNNQLFKDGVISAVENEQTKGAYDAALAELKAAQQNIKGSQYGVESAKANLNEATKNLSRSILYAPMSGIVSKLSVKRGERVAGTAQMMGTEMMRIANMSSMEVQVEIGENDIQKINIGDSSTIKVDAYPNQTFKGIVTQIASSNNSAIALSTGSEQVTNYVVHVSILPQSYQELKTKVKSKFIFRPNMSANVDIQTQKHQNIIAIPINAVTTRDSETKDKDKKTEETELQEIVFVTQNNKVYQRKVKTSIQNDEYIEITEGLKIGDEVVVAPYMAISRKLKDSMMVKTVPKEQLFETTE